jgi:hypothetical protein
MKSPKDPNGNQIHVLLAGSAVPQPTASLRNPLTFNLMLLQTTVLSTPQNFSSSPSVKGDNRMLGNSALPRV